MPRIRLKQPGWEAFTGSLHAIEFVNGVSVLDLPSVKAQQLAMNFKVEDAAAPGVAYGPQTEATTRPRAGSAPSRATPDAPVSVVREMVSLSQADYDALSVKNPDTLYVIVEG